MKANFDPYFEWLGIPPKHQPPNHYRLLNLDAFESDVPLIAAAAQRVTMRLRDIDPGAHEAEARRLLKEVMAAGSCLLDDASKAKYDQDLRAKGGATSTAALPEDDGELKLQALEDDPPVRQVLRTSTTVAEPPMALVSSSGTMRAQRAAAGQSRSRSKQDPATLAVLLLLLLAVCGTALYVVLNRPEESEDTQAAGETQLEAKPKKSSTSKRDEQPIKPRIRRVEKNNGSSSTGNSGEGLKLDPIDAIVAMPVVKPLPFAEEPDLVDELAPGDKSQEEEIDPKDKEAAEEYWKKGRAAVGRGDVAKAIALLEKYVLHEASEEHRAEAEQLLKEARMAKPDEGFVNQIFQQLSDDQLTQLENKHLTIQPGFEFSHPVLSEVFHDALRKKLPAERARRAGQGNKAAE
jgi:hypothetical protein